MPVNKDFYPIAGSSGAQSTGYTIDQSIRFNDDDSSRLYRTPGSAGNRRTHTFSVWLKRANLDSSGSKFIFSRSEASYFYGYYFYQDKLTMGSGSSGTELSLRTNRLFRDPAAWYHLVLILDTTQVVASERARMYINGVREFGDFSSETYPSQDAQLWMNTTSITEIGVANPSGSKSGYFDGYMTEMYFLDGYAYGPEYFGEFDNNGIWIPKEYEEGNYGTNGFKFTGADSSSFGTDESGTGNNYTVAGLATDDQRADSPTNNYHTWASNHGYVDGGTQTFANGNLDYAVAAASWGAGQGTMGIPGSGKWTFAIKLTASLGGSSYPMFGVIDSLNQPIQDGIGLQYQSGTPANSMVFVNTYQNSTQAYFFKGGNNSESIIGSAFAHGGATNGEWQWFINSDDKELTVYHNGTIRLDAYDISFLTFPLFVGVTSYAYSGTRLLNEPGTEYTPSISGYKAINSSNIGAI